MAALCLFLAELLKFEITSTTTVAYLGSIASPGIDFKDVFISKENTERQYGQKNVSEVGPECKGTNWFHLTAS
jgi:hypothetical protein